jgi:hypothetical protein
MAGSTCSFLSGAALCVYALFSYLYRHAFSFWAMAAVVFLGIGTIFVGLFQLMIERWGVPLELPPEPPRQ